MVSALSRARAGVLCFVDRRWRGGRWITADNLPIATVPVRGRVVHYMPLTLSPGRGVSVRPDIGCILARSRV